MAESPTCYMGARQDLWLDFHNFLEGLAYLIVISRGLNGDRAQAMFLIIRSEPHTRVFPLSFTNLSENHTNTAFLFVPLR